MKDGAFSMKKVSSPLQWARVYRLYLAAFPSCERKPFRIIVRMARSGKTDVWSFREKGRFVGFATTINGEEAVLIDYLAVADGERGKGTGSRGIMEMKRRYAGRGLFVEIESEYAEADNTEDRRKRNRFYEKNGMEPMNVMASVFGTEMELLGWNCRMDFETYHAFYRDNYSPRAAENILFRPHPEAKGG